MNERKIIQFQISKITENQTLYIVALCDDGSMWIKPADTYSDTWNRYPNNIPQDGLREIR